MRMSLGKTGKWGKWGRGNKVKENRRVQRERMGGKKRRRKGEGEKGGSKCEAIRKKPMVAAFKRISSGSGILKP